LDPSFRENVTAYVGFDDDASAALREAHPLVAPHFAAIIDDFYATIEAHPDARAAIAGGAAQIARLKQSLLRWIDELTQGSFRELLDDESVADKGSVQRLVLCSGKVAYDAIARRNEKSYPAAIVRVEQLYPFPYDQIRDLLASYPNVTEVVWLQEEPDNMGPRAFVAERLWPLVPEGIGFRQVSRSGSGSPATGSHAIHVQEQADIVDRTFEGL